MFEMVDFVFDHDRITVYASILASFALVSALYFIYSTWTSDRLIKGFPLVYLEEDGLSPKQSFRQEANKTILKGIKVHNAPFQVATSTGPQLVLPPKYADELKNHPDLSFTEAIKKDFFPGYRGFEAFDMMIGQPEHNDVVVNVVRTRLTQSLGLITQNLVDEATHGVHEIFGEDKVWRVVNFRAHILDLVSRLSARVFLGPEVCRNKQWLETSRDYTIHAFLASRRLKEFHPLLRPFVQRFLRASITLDNDLKQATAIILPEVKRRKEKAQKALAAGEKPDKISDAIGWMVESATERNIDLNHVYGQLSLSLAAIHTTSEALTNALIDIMEYPELIQPLRDEVVQVVGEHGWSKTTLYKLRLMDSFFKESQRFHPPGIRMFAFIAMMIVSMRRIAMRPVNLSTGEVIPSNMIINVANKFMDATVHSDPEKFNAWRFYGDGSSTEANANKLQHVSLNTSHMAFGYGVHACPGRFFASNEMKVAFAHLLMKYDWRAIQREPEAIVDAAKNMRHHVEAAIYTSPVCEMEVRRRKEEIDIDLEPGV